MPKKQFPYPQNQPVSKAPRPIKPLRSSYSLPPQPPPIDKPTDPKKTPRKKVRRELPTGRYQWPDGFLDRVEYYTRQEFIATRPDDRNVPYFREFDTVNGIDVLHDIFNRLETEFQDLNEIHWLLTSCWEGRFPELHIFLIACGIWKFVRRDCKDVEEDNSGATHHQKAETGETVAKRTAESEKQGAEITATNGPKELDPFEGIKTLLEACKGVVDKDTLKKKRTRAVELWQQLRRASGKESTKAVLYRTAGQDKRDFDRWCKGEHPNGSTPDKDIKEKLTTDWD